MLTMAISLYRQESAISNWQFSENEIDYDILLPNVRQIEGSQNAIIQPSEV